MQGHFNINGTINGLNSILGWRSGQCTIKFKDGGAVEMNAPTMVMNGFVTGEKAQYFIDHVLITDHINKLQADLHYNPWTDNSYKEMVKKGFSSLKDKFKKKKATENEEVQLKRDDDMRIKICQISDNQQKVKKGKEERIVLMEGHGGWLSHLVFDGEVEWKIDDYIP